MNKKIVLYCKYDTLNGGLYEIGLSQEVLIFLYGETILYMKSHNKNIRKIPNYNKLINFINLKNLKSILAKIVGEFL